MKAALTLYLISACLLSFNSVLCRQFGPKTSAIKSEIDTNAPFEIPSLSELNESHPGAFLIISIAAISLFVMTSVFCFALTYTSYRKMRQDKKELPIALKG